MTLSAGPSNADAVELRCLANSDTRGQHDLVTAGIAFIRYCPLDKGRLARPDSPLATIAERHGATPGQIAPAWLLPRSPVILPIPGTSSLAHFKESLGAASIRLSAEEFRSLAPD